ncbi:ribonuclease P protein component [Enterococcus sp. PF1-24]|uniref:ribonuclease P protein component n=1 Tax=unclassified Enterococcus TaxID=2608891 RepID=UPI002474A713|nr:MULTISPECIES: ribonuclease P protein component [unclassified Enterococcus]MDH6364344.1 ribonuclease P protein component [Enterococcus sp. PFB1-1]MDH6401467.1 ribonuclease P protein component [Enterococcus sp. PF1-24]
MKKAYRVKKEQEFQKVFQQGRSCANRNFVVYTIDKPKNQHFRVGLSVGKKIGNAVERNRVKRQIRAVIFEMKDQIKENQDFIVIARPTASQLSAPEMKKNLTHVLNLAQLIKK